jgi:hypothetical protein
MIGGNIEFEIPSTTIKGGLLTKLGVIRDKVYLGQPLQISQGEIAIVNSHFYVVEDSEGSIILISPGAIKKYYGNAK